MIIQGKKRKKYIKFFKKMQKEGCFKDSYIVFNFSSNLETANEEILLYQGVGYQIKVLDIEDLANSMIYNPFVYIRKARDVESLAAALGKIELGDPFCDDVSALWLKAVIGYLWYVAPLEEQNMSMLLRILEEDILGQNDWLSGNSIDMLFEELEERNPRHFAVKQRKKYKMVDGKIAQKILIMLEERLSVFRTPEAVKMMDSDTLAMDTYGDQRTILYVNMPEEESPLFCIANILLSQIKSMYWLERMDFSGKRDMEGLSIYRIRGKKNDLDYDELEDLLLRPDTEKLNAEKLINELLEMDDEEILSAIVDEIELAESDTEK